MATTSGRRSILSSVELQLKATLLKFISEHPSTPLSSVDQPTLLAYVQRVDYRFRRMKRLQLQKMADKVLAEMTIQGLAGEDPAMEAGVLEEADADVDDLASTQTMPVVDRNALNKSITGLWMKQSAIAPQLTSDADPTNATTTLQTESGSTSTLAEAIEGMVAPTPSKKRGPEANDAKANGDPAASLADPTKRRRRTTTEPSKSSPTIYSVPRVRLSDLGPLPPATLTTILEICAVPLRHPELYLHTGIPSPRGLLLHGPSGCGKTLLARAIAGELNVPLIQVSAPSIVAGISGESEKKIREIFEDARSNAPCVLLLDEVDVVGGRRDGAGKEMERRIVAQLLTCLDALGERRESDAADSTQAEDADAHTRATPSLKPHSPVLVIGATNRPDALDAALRRAGRFDREVGLGVPDETAREGILRVLTRGIRLAPELDYREIAKRTPGYVGADILSLVATAGMAAVRRIFKTLEQDDTPGEQPSDFAVDAGNDSTQLFDAMDVDDEILAEPTSVTAAPPPPLPSNPIADFLKSYPSPLTAEQLAPLCIQFEDFIDSIPRVQPSAQREGFATVPDVTWQDIGALDAVRDELRMAVVEPIRFPEYFERVGIRSPAGVLLWGPPGCGKTLLAKAVANESRTNFISVKGPELLNKYVGESERAVRQVFARARASSPCVVFFDELDALCARRDDSGSEAGARVVNTLLTELDGVENRKQVFVIGATNRPDIIDSAMMRPGRLDKLLYVELPTPPERASILEALSRRSPLAEDVDLGAIVNDSRAEGYSGADLAALVREAGVAALRETLYSLNMDDVDRKRAHAESVGKDLFVRQKHFVTALSKVPPSVSAKDKESYDRLRKRFGGGTA